MNKEKLIKFMEEQGYEEIDKGEYESLCHKEEINMTIFHQDKTASKIYFKPKTKEMEEKQ